MGKLRIQNWSLGRIVREMEGRLLGPTLGGDPPKGVSTDTRKLQEGELFFALRGDRFDGHEFVDQAVAAGACAVVVDDRSAVEVESVATVVVDDCIEALGRLGRGLYRQAREQGVHSVAITGSNGKTTTKELLSTLWSIDGEVWATPGNLNNHIGVPLTLCAMPADCDHLVVEMGANHRGEILELVKLVPADERIITSIGRAHLEGFGSMAGVRKAKSEIFEYSSRSTTAVVPWTEVEALIPLEFPGNVVTFGTESGSTVRILSTQTFSKGLKTGMQVTLEIEGRRRNLELPLMGRHNATNLAAAMAALGSRALEYDEPTLNDALAKLELPGGRQRWVSVGSLEVMDDAYNANPSSMRASFRAFEQWCEDEQSRPAVAVIGDMHELGKEAKKAHQRLARWLAGRNILDGVAFFGEYAEAMAEAVEGSRIRDVARPSGIDDVVEWLLKFDAARVFIKGSRGNRLERIVDGLEDQS